MHAGMAIAFGWAAHAFVLVGLEILAGERTVRTCAEMRLTNAPPAYKPPVGPSATAQTSMRQRLWGRGEPLRVRGVSGTTELVTGTSRRDDDTMGESFSHVIVTDPADLTMVTFAVGESGPIGLDTETTGLVSRTDRLRLFSLACDTVDGGTAVYVIDAFAVPDLTPLCESFAAATIVGHNLLFDVQFLARLGFAPGTCRDAGASAQGPCRCWWFTTRLCWSALRHRPRMWPHG
jgi:hypothetical protein